MTAPECRFKAAKAALAALFLLLSPLVAAQAPRAQSDDLYTVSGVKVDVRAADAAQAKLKAISEGQVKAFRQLVERLGEEGALASLSQLQPSQIGRLMASLSIEDERTGPGRYIASLTIKFLPDKVRALLASSGVDFVEQQAPATVILPVWKTAQGPVVWEDNPWREAWNELKLEDALVPLIVPIGDLTDTNAISAREALEGDPIKLESIRIRYDAGAILVAIAEPRSDNAVRASMVGDSPVGKVLFDKTYVAPEGGIDAAARQAVERFHTVMTYKWKEANRSAGAVAGAARSQAQALTVAVPFTSLEEWNGIRARLLNTPGVSSVGISSLTSGGAHVQLDYVMPLEDLQASLSHNRLSLVLVGGRWVLQTL